MALVKDIVARFRTESNDYVEKMNGIRAANRAAAEDLVKTAGSAEKAIGALSAAKNSRVLGEFGIDKRQVSGIISQIKSIDAETRKVVEQTKHVGEEWRENAEQARAYHHIEESFEQFSKGNLLRGIQQFSHGTADLAGGGGGLGGIIGAGVAVGALDIVGGKLREMTEKARELKEEFHDGQIGVAGIVDQLLGGLPVLGNIYTATKNIIDLTDDSTSAYERQAEAMKQQAEQSEKLLEILREQKKLHEDNAKETQQIVGQAHDQDLRNRGLNITADADEVNRKYQAQRDEYVKKQQEEARKAKSAIDAAIPDQAPLHHQLTEQLGQATRDKDQGKIDELTDRLKQIEFNQGVKERRKGEIDQKMWKDVGAHNAAINDAQSADLKKVLGNSVSVSEAQGKETGHKFFEAMFKGFESSRIGEWVHSQADKAKGIIEKLRQDFNQQLHEDQQKAQQFRQQNETAGQKMHDQLAEAEFLQSRGLITKGDIGNFDNKNYRDLMAEQRKLQDEGPRDVYKLPNVSEIRRGSALFAPPTKTDPEQVRRLAEIRDLLQQIKDNAAQNGITLEVTT